MMRPFALAAIMLLSAGPAVSQCLQNGIACPDPNTAAIASNTAALTTGAATRSFDEMNTLSGNGFSWGTGVQTIPANSYLNIQFTNPAGSGKTDFIILREFGNASTTVLQAILRTNCTQIAGSTSVAGGNRYMTSANTTASTLTYQIGTTAISTGTLGPALMLNINGQPTDSDLLRVVPPGQSFCYIVQGLTGAFAASAQVSFSVAGSEK